MSALFWSTYEILGKGLQFFNPQFPNSQMSIIIVSILQVCGDEMRQYV